MVELTKGWKSYLGAALIFASAIYALMNGHNQEALTLFGVGLGILGIRHKLGYDL